MLNAFRPLLSRSQCDRLGARLLQSLRFSLWAASLLWVLSACAVQSTDRPVASPSLTSPSPVLTTPASPIAQPDPPPASLIAQLKTMLNDRYGIAQEAVSVKSAEAVQWNDACLGIVQADRLCAQVITPGYRIVLRTDTQEFEFHTDRSGAAVQLVSP